MTHIDLLRDDRVLGAPMLTTHARRSAIGETPCDVGCHVLCCSTGCDCGCHDEEN